MSRDHRYLKRRTTSEVVNEHNQSTNPRSLLIMICKASRRTRDPWPVTSNPRCMHAKFERHDSAGSRLPCVRRLSSFWQRCSMDRTILIGNCPLSFFDIITFRGPLESSRDPTLPSLSLFCLPLAPLSFPVSPTWLSTRASSRPRPTQRSRKWPLRSMPMVSSQP